MTQINPPFDGSAPCPMCQQDLRGFCALLHNTFVRWGEGKMYVKLNDIRRYHATPIELTVPHPATEKAVALQRDLIAALDGMTDDGQQIRWTPQVAERVAALYGRFQEVLVEIEPLSDAHFDDDRHSSGQINILREQRGGRGDLYKTGAGYSDYAYTVEAVAEGGELRHTVCGTNLRLHDHFKERLARDPDFYGRVWCPTCINNVPIAQFERLSDG